MQRLLVLFCLFGVAACDNLRCGSEFPKSYNPETHDCKNGTVIEKITTKQTKRSCESTVAAISQQISAYNLLSDSKADVLDCKLSLQRGKAKGRQCCGGFDTYNPRFETCCQRDMKSAVRHRHKKEREHACCTESSYDLSVVYRRGSRKIPCKHPSLNDKLFRGKHLSNLVRHCKKYMNYNFVYAIRIHKKIQLYSLEYYNASITKLTWKHKWLKETSYYKRISVDKYSPNVKRINEKLFIVLSDYDQNKALDFYLDRASGMDDVVFKEARAKKKFIKRFNKMWKKCRNESTRSKYPVYN